MEYRLLGRTGLRLSAIGFGAAPLGGVYHPTDFQQASRAVGAAIDAGINYFDVAPYYGLTLAESRLGEALAGRRKEIILSSKCCRFGFDDFDFSAGRVASSLEESLARLRTDYLDLLIAHDIEFGDLRQVVEETLPAMQQARAAGKVRFLGVSGYPLRVLAHVARQFPLDFLLSYCHDNLLNTRLQTELLPLAQERGLGLINASPLHMGVLTEEGPPEWHPAPAELFEAGRQVVAICRRHGVAPATVALRFALDEPGLSSTLVGMTSVAELETNLRALDYRLPPNLLAEIQHVIAPVRDLEWPSGRPEHEHLPSLPNS